MKRRLFSRSKSTKRSTNRWKNTFSSRAELLEARQMLAGDLLQNPANMYDVNGDSYVSAIDAQMVVMASGNVRASQVAGQVAGEPGENSSVFADVNGDGTVNDLDLTAVVSEINNPAGEPGDVVTFRFETVDLSGSAITNIDSGNEFELVVFVEDSRDTPLGLFAGYLDIEYPAALATTQEIIYSGRFQDGKAGEVTVDGAIERIDEVGAFDTDQPATPVEEELFRVRMRADSPGNLEFTSNAGDLVPLSDVLVFQAGSEDTTVDPGDILFPSITLQVNGAQTVENDLVAFAKALDTANVELWTSGVNARGNAAEQLALFSEGEHFLPINEVFDFVATESGADRFPLTTAAVTSNVTQTNIWIWPDGTRSDGSVLTLEEIATESGVAIPQSDDPSIVPIDDVTVLQGSPLHIPLDGYDPNGDPLTYTVSVGDDSLIETFIPQGNRSLRIPVTQDSEVIGDFVFELYEARAPLATQRIIDLEATDFHDDIIFHRIIDGFVIQGGDPTGTGTGGSTLGDFDDQFHVDLQHNQVGVLSMAKAGDDTNDSQFFITETDTRSLDFNHTVFGQLIEGERVRQTTSNVETTGGNENKPLVDISMNGVEIFEDNENAVVMLRALADTGTTTVTVTATDSAGNSTMEVFTVDLADDPVNNEPFLQEIGDLTFESGATDSFQVESVDIEGDAVEYSVFFTDTQDADGNDDDVVSISDTGVLTASGWKGTREIAIRVSSGPIVSQFSPFDQQVVSLTLSGTAPTSVDLVAAADSGLSDSDNITNVTELQFEVSGVADGDTVIVFSGDTEVGRAVATGSTIVITQANTSVLGSGEQIITAVAQANGVTSQPSPALTVTLDQTAPAAITNAAPTAGEVSVAYTFDAAHEEEAAGDIRYSLDNAPAGMAIDALTGVVSWIPSGDQRGVQAFDIVVTDLAGNENVTSSTVAIEGADGAGVSLTLRDSTGQATNTIANGENFFIDVFVEDIRTDASGVTQAFVDIAFDAQGVAEVDSSGSIQIGPSFADSQQTGTISATGVINVGGASSTPVVGRTLLATIPMVAQSLGSLNIDVGVNATGILLDGESQPVSAADVQLSGSSLTVLDVSSTLTAVDDALTIDEDSGEHVIDVLINDTVTTTSGPVTITSVADPSEDGTVAISTDGTTLLYTPGADFPVDSPVAETETFDYTITDSLGATSTATVTVTVNPVNDPPVAVDDAFPADFSDEHAGQWAINLREDSTDVAELFVIQNDNPGPDGENFLFIQSANSDNGATVELIKNRTWIGYTPAANLFGEDTFTYTIEDATDVNLTDTATVTVTIAPVNDAPTAENDSITIQSGETAILDAAEFIGNDTAGPLEDDSQTLTIVDVTQPNQGTVTINADGTISFTPNAGAVGTDSFEYTVSDDGMTEDFDAASTSFIAREDFLEATATVTVTYNVGNSKPSANNDVFPVVNDGTEITLPVLLNDQDDGGVAALEVTAVGATSEGGTVTLTDGLVLYQAATDFVGTDTFTYTVTDGELTDTAEVTVNVQAAGSATNSRFTGSVFFDVDGDGVQDSTEPGIAGVPFSLEGTDSNGNAVSRAAISNANGAYNFDALPVGDYSVSQTQSAFLVDGAETAASFASATRNDEFSITVPDSIVISEGNTFAEQGLSTKFALLDAISSSRRRSGGFLTAVGDSGSEFVHGVSGWDGYSNIRVDMSSDQTEVTIRATDENAQNVIGTLDATDKSLVSIIGRDGGTWLLRITAAAIAANLQEDTANAAATDSVFAGGS